MATLLELTAEIVNAHASSTQMTQDDLLQELQKVYTYLKSLEASSPITSATTEAPKLTIKQAFKKNEIICMVCGKGGMKILTRHIKTAHDMKPSQYKKQFGIPNKQPLTAKSYTVFRKQMALEIGLGDVLANARKVRMAKIQSKKDIPAVRVKPPVPAVKSKAAAPDKLQELKASSKTKRLKTNVNK